MPIHPSVRIWWTKEFYSKFKCIWLLPTIFYLFSSSSSSLWTLSVFNPFVLSVLFSIYLLTFWNYTERINDKKRSRYIVLHEIQRTLNNKCKASKNGYVAQTKKVRANFLRFLLPFLNFIFVEFFLKQSNLIYLKKMIRIFWNRCVCSVVPLYHHYYYYYFCCNVSLFLKFYCDLLQLEFSVIA